MASESKVIEVLDGFKRAMSEIRKLHREADAQAFDVFQAAVAEVAKIYDDADVHAWELFKATVDEARKALSEIEPLPKKEDRKPPPTKRRTK